jgi:aspartate aminotransferase-like enzyme/GNAT superfamily N-acetyltransferase
MAALHYKIADRPVEFETIHRLNYQTFVEEIPQHTSNAAGVLVDRFHHENVYAICMSGDELVGMVAGRCIRPFSLDSKVVDLDSLLPCHRKAVEVRLLAVRPQYRHRQVFARLVALLAGYFRSMDCDLAVISGTVRQLRLYEHMGFRCFGPLTGAADALYQPMYLTLEAWQDTRYLAGMAEPTSVVQGFLPGPVAVSAAVRRAFHSEPVSHRSRGFMARMTRIRATLCGMTGAAHVAVLAGTGTLANDAIAAQLRHAGTAGLVLVNGEFGERLAAHARGWQLQHDVVRRAWGEAFDWEYLHGLVCEKQPAWIWAVLSETSTGMTNSPVRLRELCEGAGAALCLDAVSAIGLMPVDLQGVWLASAVSGKGLAAYAGLAMVFHDGRLAPAGALPRYLDLALYEDSGGVPYSQSSNLVAALDCALTSTRWSQKFQRIAAVDRDLRARFRAHGLAPLVPDEVSTPGIITLAMPVGCNASQLARALRKDGIALAYESPYLQCRNWLQICLMGEFETATVGRIPDLLAARICHSGASSWSSGSRQFMGLARQAVPIQRRRLLFATAAAALIRPALSQEAERRVRVALDEGNAALNFEDEIRDFEAVLYVVPLRQRQWLHVLLATDNASNCFDIHAPGEPRPVYVGADSGNTCQLLAPTTGDYTVRVFLLRLAARDGQSARYTLELKLTG